MNPNTPNLRDLDSTFWHLGNEGIVKYHIFTASSIIDKLYIYFKKYNKHIFFINYDSLGESKRDNPIGWECQVN